MAMNPDTRMTAQSGDELGLLSSRFASRVMPSTPNKATSAAAPRGSARDRNTPRPNANEPTATSPGNSSGCNHHGSVMGRKFSAAAYAQRPNPPSVTSQRHPAQAVGSRGQHAHESHDEQHQRGADGAHQG